MVLDGTSFYAASVYKNVCVAPWGRHAVWRHSAAVPRSDFVRGSVRAWKWMLKRSCMIRSERFTTTE